MNVFVLMSRKIDAAKWSDDYLSGSVPDLTPYGYHHAAGAEVKLAFSKPSGQHGVMAFLSSAIRRLLGFDLVHAWINRKEIFGAGTDVIWTHTELEHLAIRMLEVLYCGAKQPAPVIAQSVWLIDNWAEYSWIRKAFFKTLLKRNTMMTFLSPLNTHIARQLELCDHIELMPFGISLDSFPLTTPIARFREGRALRIFVPGNDRHRDWETLIKAIGDIDECEIVIASSSFPGRLKSGNVTVKSLNQDDIIDFYHWADCVIIPLKENLHASGLTVMLEAVALGLPVVATKVGGLDYYFSDEHVNYVPVGDWEKLRSAILNLRIFDNKAKIERAQKRIIDHDLTTEGYAKRHVELSRGLLKQQSEIVSRRIV